MLEGITEEISNTRSNTLDISNDVARLGFPAEARDETFTWLHRMEKAIYSFKVWTEDVKRNMRNKTLRQFLPRNSYRGQVVTQGSLVNKADHSSTDWRENFLAELFDALGPLEGVLNDLYIAMDNAARRFM